MKKHLQNQIYVVCSITFISCFLFAATPAYAGDPDIAYHTLKTEHFNIHYDNKLEKMAQRAAMVSEDIYSRVTTTLGWEVEGTVQIQIVDSTDYPNGLASTHRYPFIQLYATPPDIDSPLQYFDDYLYTLILHEFTHITHIQMQYGISRIYNSVFGDVYLPNSMQPTWFVEGLAVLLETTRTTRGRIRSPYYHMVIRTHALEGKLQTLAQASNSTLAYPRGSADYIYGSLFMKYLYDRFGEDAIVKMCHRYAAQPIPYGLNRIFQEVTQVPLVQLWEDWTQKMVKEAKQVQAQVQQEGQTDSIRLTHNGESKGHPIVTSDGEIILPVSDGIRRSALTVLSSDGEEIRRLALAGTGADITMTARGDIYLTRSAPSKDFYRFRDLFVLESDKSELRQLTYGARVKQAAASKQGDKVVIVTNSLGQTQLEMVDGQGANRQVLLPAKENVQYYGPALSPNGKMLAFIRRINERVDIALMDLSTQKYYYITKDKAVEQSLQFSPDGRYLLYASDITGISNIFAANMQTGQILQVTNVDTSANYPALSPDGQTLYFLKYYAHGWDLHRAAINLDSLESYRVLYEPPYYPREIGDVELKDEPYNPLPTFRPYAWELSYLISSEQRLLSASAHMQDAAGLHFLSTVFDYEFDAKTPVFSASYAYKGLRPTVKLQFSHSSVKKETGYLVGGMPAPWTRQSYSGYFGFSAPIPRLDDSHSISLGYAMNYSSPKESLDVEVDPHGPLPDIPTQYFRAGLKVGWSYSKLFGGPYSVSREDGRAIHASASLYHPSLGGTQELLGLGWGWREYKRAPWHEHHVFALDWSGFVYISNPQHQSSIHAGGYGPQNYLDAVMNEATMGLPRIRGYTPDFLSGDHYQSLRLEYRFPIWYAQLAYATLPVFLRTVHCAVFNDNLLIAYDSFDKDDYFTTIGTEVVWSFYLGYFLPLALRTGYARGLMDGGINEFILVIGGSF